MLNNLGAKKIKQGCSLLFTPPSWTIAGVWCCTCPGWSCSTTTWGRKVSCTYIFTLNFAHAHPFLQVCSYEALESADSLAEAALTAWQLIRCANRRDASDFFGKFWSEYVYWSETEKYGAGWQNILRYCSHLVHRERFPDLPDWVDSWIQRSQLSARLMAMTL